MENLILINYLSKLDWFYILTFILLGYAVNHCRVRKTIQHTVKLTAWTRYRVALTGIVYGIALYFIRGYSLAHTEVLISSFVFALVFHKLIIDGIISALGGKKSSDQPYGNPDTESEL
jgi:hypothetical protein